MAVIGESRKIHSRFKYLIDCDGVASMGFQSCSALEAEVAKQEYYEGGSVIPDKQPTRVTVSDITLERGAASGDRDLYDWFSQVVDVAANSGLSSPEFKRSFDIVQQDRNNTELRRWTVYGAWPSKFVAGEWDNTSDDATIEQVVLTVDYFELAFEAGA